MLITRGGGGEECYSGYFFCWVCATGLSESLPHDSPFFGHIIDSILVTLEKKSNFRTPNLAIFCLCDYLIKPFNFT